MFHRYPDTNTLLKIHIDTDTQNSYRYRYQIPIPSLRFIPIPISEKSTDTRSYTDIYTDISVWNRYPKSIPILIPIPISKIHTDTNTDTDIQNPYRYRYLNFISYQYRYWYLNFISYRYRYQIPIVSSGIGMNISIGGTLATEHCSNNLFNWFDKFCVLIPPNYLTCPLHTLNFLRETANQGWFKFCQNL